MLSKDRRDRDREGSRDRDRYGDRERERGRDRSRDRSRRHSSSNNGGDLRDRLTDKYKDSDSYRDQHCDLSSSGKKQLLSMFLDGNNPVKDLKGKENEKSDEASENKKSKKEVDKSLSSEWAQRKKKKKKRSRSRSKPEKDRKPLVDREGENRKRKYSPESQLKDGSISKIKKEKHRIVSLPRQEQPLPTAWASWGQQEEAQIVTKDARKYHEGCAPLFPLMAKTLQSCITLMLTHARTGLIRHG